MFFLIVVLPDTDLRVGLVFSKKRSEKCDLTMWRTNIIPAATARVDLRKQVWRGFFESTIYNGMVLAFMLCNLVICGVGTWGILAKNGEVINVSFYFVQGFFVIIVLEFFGRVILNKSLWAYAYGNSMELVVLIGFFVVNMLAITMNRGLCVICCLIVQLKAISLLKFFDRTIASFLALRVLFASTLFPLMSVYCLFGWLGIYFYGGNMYLGQPLLIGTVYDQSNYYTLNWNDLSSALVTQFVLLVGNNGFIVADGAAAVTIPLAKLYFVLFWIICVLIILNLFFAAVFRMADLAKEDPGEFFQSSDVVVEARSEEDLDDKGGADGKSFVSLKKGKFTSDVEMEDFEKCMNELADGKSKMKLRRGASAIFTAKPTVQQSIPLLKLELEAGLEKDPAATFEDESATDVSYQRTQRTKSLHE